MARRRVVMMEVEELHTFRTRYQLEGSVQRRTMLSLARRGLAALLAPGLLVVNERKEAFLHAFPHPLVFSFVSAYRAAG